MDASRGLVGLTLAAALLLGACATRTTRPSALREEVVLEMDGAAWVLHKDAHDELTALRGYAPAGERTEPYSAYVTVETYSFGGMPFPGIAGTLRYERAGLQGRCPSMQWTVLEESEGNALYEWRIAGCEGIPDQHEVGRVMTGRTVWARLSYSVQGKMDDAVRAEWIRRLSAARFSPLRLAGPPPPSPR